MVCCDTRTGSTLLCEALKETGVAGIPIEYFNSNPAREQHRRAYLGIESDGEYLEKIIAGSTTPNGVFGTKIHPRQFSVLLQKIEMEGGVRVGFDGAVLAARFPNLHYIWLARENKIRQAISLYRAKENKTWWKFAEMPAYVKQIEIPTKDPEFDFISIEKNLRLIRYGERFWKRYFQRNGITPLFLTYEELSNDLTGVVRRVLGYLKLPSDIPEVRPPMIRQADAVTDEWERRFRELQSR